MKMFAKVLSTKHFLLFAVLALSLSQASSNWLTCYSKPNGAVSPVAADCHVYIYCLYETPFTLPCPLGMGFSVSAGRCVQYSQSDCVADNVAPTAAHRQHRGTCDNEQRPENKLACQGQPFGELVPYPGDCSKFLVCNCEYPTVKQCPSGTWFDNTIKVCNYPQNVNCVDGNGSGSTAATTIMTTELTTMDVITTTHDWGKDCEAPDGMQADICLKYNNGLLLRYPYNCNAYINCTMGCPVMNYCPTDKVFNNFLKICDTPDTAQCIELPLPTTTEQPTTTTEETTTELITTTDIPEQCLTPLAVDKHICSNQYQGSYLPYDYNCTAYVICKDEEPCLEYCENGKIFNSLLGICDDDIECHELPLPSTPQEPETTTTISITLPPDVDSDLCQGKQDYTIYPYEGDCTQYLECKDQEVIVENCPQGWLFNSKLMLCDEASEDVCYTGAITTTEEPTTTGEPVYDLCLGQPLGTTFPNKENCALYYYCRGNGHFYVLPCPYNNYYDPYSGNCGPDVSSTACLEPITTTAATTTQATTLSPSQKCANAAVGITYPYEENCAKYIYCKGNGGFLLMNCPYNNYYDPVSGDCEPSDDVDICRKPTTPETTTPEISTTISPATTPKPEPVLGICGNYSNGQLINYPDNCQKYISCVRPIPIGFYCNNNWYFNEQQQKCVPDSEGTCIGLPANETTTAATPSDICQGLKEGDSEIYSSNCQLYYECLGDGYYMLKTCTEGEYFDPLTGQCSAQVGAEYCKQNFDTTLAPPAKPQGICSDQPEGWKVPYPHNCSKYIECAKPIPIGFSCMSDLEFSSEAQECVEPSASDCGLTTTNTPSNTPTLPTPTKPYNQCTNKPDFTLLPYEENCTMFIICLEDMEHWAYCKTGEYFDLTEAKCLASANEESCRASSTTEPTTITTQDPNLGPCYNKPDGSKIPYPNNCTKYIECHYPLNVGYDCPQGLEFSAHYEECVEPNLADCSIKTSPTMPTTTEITTTPQPVETCENKPTGTTLSYPEDCSKYYMCINGQEKLTNCMPQSYYDPATGECDNDVSPTACQGPIAATTTTESSETNTTTAQSPQGPCSDESNGFIYANVQDCSQYYMCLDSSSVLCKCQNQTYYNPYTGECDGQTSNSECKEPITSSTDAPEITTPITETPDGNICCGHKSGSYLPYPGDNTKYVICQYPLPEVYSCPEGSTYDAESLSCKLVATFTISKPECTQLNYGEKYVYKGDCTKYYFCYGSEAVVLDCSFDWNYNPAIDQCVPKVQYKCPW
ncbi:chitin-binding domain protein cbd-1-like [Calliphora vicina]|uniref:chitin-binding domain protein cbd-1-like n=1 Tax=Calliphora vicina TaxID=7373 RepID=UPI00325AF3D6